MNDDNTITINGTATSMTWVELLADFIGSVSPSNVIHLPLNINENYIIKTNIISGTFAGTARFYNQINGNASEVYSDLGNSSTINNSDGLYRSWLRVNSGATFTNLKISIQLEEGTTATPYTSHQEQTFTFPLGNEKLMLGDYLADDGIHHVRGQVVLDGSEDENWNRTTSNDIARFDIAVADFKTGTSTASTATFLSNYFIAKGLNDLVSGNIGISWWWSESSKRIVICLGDNKTTAEFKTWLSTHNTPVEYELEEEVIVPYTSAQQEEYNQIKQALSYEEQTNISSNTIALFNVEAYQSTKLVLEENNAKYESLEARVALLE